MTIQNYEKSNLNKVSIDISNFSAGLYFIRINIHDKFFNRKIILKR
ncbi:MAG: T9SS type A sorting domain-containing protein [Saprospiraceae bacterium]|nr:T9SS type A sorting domain-containing protein [Saprospiraceae bacterium]MBK9720357.1 T9SS type A sorting domain-containing protein [Saprospiraceae bacterium]